MTFVRDLGVKVTACTRARCWPKARSTRCRKTSASSKLYLWAINHARRQRHRPALGAAQALRAVSLKAEPGKVTCVGPGHGVARPAFSSAGRPAAGDRGTNHLEGIRHHRRSSRRSGGGRGIAYCIRRPSKSFPSHWSRENLRYGFLAPLPREQRSVPDDVFSLFPGSESPSRARRAAATFRRPQRSSPSASRWLMRRRLLRSTITTRRHPAVSQDSAALSIHPLSLGQIAIRVWFESIYLDFAVNSGDHFAVHGPGRRRLFCNRA